MKLETLSMKNNDEHLSKSILETTPRIMRFIREEMRKQAKGKLTIPQFRVLLKLAREPSLSQSEVADWMGIAAPTLTKMIDTLVKRKLVKRIKDAKDLRCTRLSATPAGEKIHQLYKEEVLKKIILKIDQVSTSEKKALTTSLATLAKIFS